MRIDTDVNGAANSRLGALVRFTVPALGTGETITAASLRLTVTNPTSNGPAVYRTAGGWSEATTTWEMRPASIGTTTVGNFGTFGTGVRSTPVSGVTSGGDVSFELFAESGDSADAASREATSADARPQLVLTIRSD
jgi:hypothetical protein